MYDVLSQIIIFKLFVCMNSISSCYFRHFSYISIILIGQFYSSENMLQNIEQQPKNKGKFITYSDGMAENSNSFFTFELPKGSIHHAF